MKSITLYYEDRDQERIDELRREDEAGDYIFINSFAGDGVVVYFDEGNV
jgi:hypothetical protein